ncbi:hypothetical protein ACFYY2_04865 [Streptomyces sp. NPDC001822]
MRFIRLANAAAVTVTLAIGLSAGIAASVGLDKPPVATAQDILWM